MIEDTGGAAYPNQSDQHGVTWVDQCAFFALQGLLARQTQPGPIDFIALANDAYEIAKAMMVRREFP